MKSVLAWLFLSDDGKLADGHWHPVQAGSILEVPSGLRAYTDPLSALIHAPGSLVCRVRLEGEIKRRGDIVEAPWLKVLWIGEANKTLHLFALHIAKSVLVSEQESGRAMDTRSSRVLRAKGDFLNGKASRELIEAIGNGAWLAEREVTRPVARTAAECLAWASVLDCIFAAWGTAHASGRREAQLAREYINETQIFDSSDAVSAVAQKAAWTAAIIGAERATRDLHSTLLHRMLLKLRGGGKSS